MRLYLERCGTDLSNITIHERPGVYSAFDASAVYGAADGIGVIGVAAAADSGETDEVVTVTSLAEGVAAFGESGDMGALLEVLYANGAGVVKAVRVSAETESGYEAAFKLLETEEDIRVMLCGSTQSAVQLKLKKSVEDASNERRERIAVVASDEQNVSDMKAHAALLNSERMVLAAGRLREGGSCLAAAAAIAAVIAKSGDPSLPVSGAELYGVEDIIGRFNDAEIDLLVRGGVTAVENIGGETAAVRAVTTRTTTGGAADATWRELTTVLIADNVICGLRNVLRSRFARSKNTAQTRGAIRSQIIMELEGKLAQQIIDGYGDVRVKVAENDPTVCEATFDFAVAHGLSRIYLTAHISV